MNPGDAALPSGADGADGAGAVSIHVEIADLGMCTRDCAVPLPPTGVDLVDILVIATGALAMIACGALLVRRRTVDRRTAVSFPEVNAP